MKEKKIYIAGHLGMVGSAVLNTLSAKGYDNIITRSREQLDLCEQLQVQDFMNAQKPDAIVVAAAKVGGILANDQYPYEFLYNNLMIQNNIINAAHACDVNHLIFLGSSCIYPKHAPQPLSEEYLLTGPLEPTNQWYAVAKIVGVKLCQALNRQYGRNYITLMPTNLYGPRDNFDLKTSHVVPAMIRKFHEAKEQGHAPVTLWGSGTPKREFLYVNDLADAICFALEHELQRDMYNIGCGRDLSIRALAALIQQITGHRGDIIWDDEKPDGTPRKLLDVTAINSEGWEAVTDLEAGLQATYQWFLGHEKEVQHLIG